MLQDQAVELRRWNGAMSREGMGGAHTRLQAQGCTTRGCCEHLWHPSGYAADRWGSPLTSQTFHCVSRNLLPRMPQHLLCEVGGRTWEGRRRLLCRPRTATQWRPVRNRGVPDGYMAFDGQQEHIFEHPLQVTFQLLCDETGRPHLLHMWVWRAQL